MLTEHCTEQHCTGLNAAAEDMHAYDYIMSTHMARLPKASLQASDA